MVSGSTLTLPAILKFGSMVALSTDHQLLQEFATSRCEQSLARLIDRHLAVVRGVALRLLQDPATADDAVQSSFTILAQQASAVLQGLDPAGSLAPWLCRVATNEALQIRRSARRRQRRERVAARSCFLPARDPAAEAESLRVLHEELHGLPVRYQEPVVLCYLTGETQESAAALLRVSRSTLKRRLQIALGQLRSRLERRGCTLPALGTLLLVAAAQRTASTSSSATAQSLAVKAFSTVPAVASTTTSVSLSLFGSLRAMTPLMLLKTSVVASGLASCLALGVMAANDPASSVDVTRGARLLADKNVALAAAPREGAGEVPSPAETGAEEAKPAREDVAADEPQPAAKPRKSSRSGTRDKKKTDNKSPRVAGNGNRPAPRQSPAKPQAETPFDGMAPGGTAGGGATASARGSASSRAGGRAGGSSSGSSVSRSGGRFGGNSGGSSMTRSGGGALSSTSSGGTGGKSFQGMINRNGKVFQTDDPSQFPDFDALVEQMQKEAFGAAGLPLSSGVESSSFHGTLSINGQTLEFDSPEEYEAARRKYGLK